MRIILATQSFPPRIGGIESVMEALAKRLSEYFEVIVFSDRNIENFDKGKKFPIKIHSLNAPKIIRPFIKKFLIKKYTKKEDILICDSWKSIKAIPKLTYKKIIVLAHGQEYFNKKNKNKIINVYLKRSNVLIANSKFTLNLVLELNKFKKIDKHVIPPTLALTDKLTEIGKNKPKKDKIILLSLSRIEERKGLMQTMIAISSLQKKNKLGNLFWHIAGDGPQLKELKIKAEKLGILSRINFHGNISELEKKKLFKISNLFIMPSFIAGNSVEGFGIVYIEAAIYGIPSISGIEGGVKEAVIDKKTGWNINPLNEKNFENILFSIISNPKEIIKRGKAARNLYLKKFTSRIILKKIITIILN